MRPYCVTQETLVSACNLLQFAGPYVGELLQFELGSCHLPVLVVTAGDTKASGMRPWNKMGFVEVRGPGVTPHQLHDPDS